MVAREGSRAAHRFIVRIWTALEGDLAKVEPLADLVRTLNAPGNDVVGLNASHRLVAKPLNGVQPSLGRRFHREPGGFDFSIDPGGQIHLFDGVAADLGEFLGESLDVIEASGEFVEVRRVRHARNSTDRMVAVASKVFGICRGKKRRDSYSSIGRHVRQSAGDAVLWTMTTATIACGTRRTSIPKPQLASRDSIQIRRGSSLTISTVNRLRSARNRCRSSSLHTPGTRVAKLRRSLPRRGERRRSTRANDCERSSRMSATDIPPPYP
jgi:hypothetical protein